jgi:hypothetical protein
MAAAGATAGIGIKLLMRKDTKVYQVCVFGCSSWCVCVCSRLQLGSRGAVSLPGAKATKA